MNGNNIRIDNSSQDLTLTTDRTLLLRVLVNMLKNALEATPQGEVVTVLCRSMGETVDFSVHNVEARYFISNDNKDLNKLFKLTIYHLTSV